MSRIIAGWNCKFIRVVSVLYTTKCYHRIETRCNSLQSHKKEVVHAKDVLVTSSMTTTKTRYYYCSNNFRQHEEQDDPNN